MKAQRKWDFSIEPFWLFGFGFSFRPFCFQAGFGPMRISYELLFDFTDEDAEGTEVDMH